jgi:protein-L-isoaspartate O-methyltransferase
MKTNKIHFTDDAYYFTEQPSNSTFMHPHLCRIVQRLGAKNVLEIGSGNGLLMAHLQQFTGWGG